MSEIAAVNIIDNEPNLKKESCWSRCLPRSCWGYSWISRRMPITQWIFQYSRKNIFYDIIAGLTVASMAVPQSIAHASVAGLAPQRGLYTEVFPGLVYLILGSTPYTIISTTSLTSMLFQPITKRGIAYESLLTFINGVIIFGLGLLQLGFVVDFISLPVVAGFVSAAAITIISSQIPSLTGIVMSPSTFDFIESWKIIFREFHAIRCGDTLTGLLTILLLLGFQHMEKIPYCTRYFKVLSKSRYLVLIITGTLAAYGYSKGYGDMPFFITGSVVEGRLPFAPPDFSTKEGNTTVNFFEMVEEIGLRVVVLPVVSIMQLFVVAKVFSEGEHIHVNQELMTLGIINICGSFLASIPVSGSFSRTAINMASGVRSSFSGVLTPITVILAIYFWSDSFYYIPKAVLAGMVICTMWPLIDIQMPIDLWSTKKKDLIPMAATFFACLCLNLPYGILIGVIINLFIVLHRSARPNISCELFEVAQEKVLVLSPFQNLYFPAADAVLKKITHCSTTHSQEATIIVINGHLIKRIDASVAETFSTFYKLTQKTNKKFVFWNWEAQPKYILTRTVPAFEMLFRDSENLETLLAQMDIVVPFDLTARPFYYR